MKKVKIFTVVALAALAAAATVAPVAGVAQEARPVMSKVTAATVFLRGAELTSTATLTLGGGASEVSIEGLSPDVDRASIRVNIGGGVVVSAHEFSIDYLSSARGEADSPRLRMLRDSMEIYSAGIERVDADIAINNDMKNYLAAGTTKNVSGSEAGLGIDELRRTMDYFKSKSEEIHAAGSELNRRRDRLRGALARVRNQLNEESGRGDRSSGVLRLSLTAPAAGTYTATITCFTPGASWSPYYDINAASTDRPVAIAARSRVSQNTGMDWENVRLTLSTATPSNGRVAPLFSTWFLRERATFRPVPAGRAMQNTVSYPPDITVRGVVTDEKGTPLAGAAIRTPAGFASTDMSGAYTIGALSGGEITFAYIGFVLQTVPVNGRSVINARLEPDLEAMNEVIVMGYPGARKDALAGAVAVAPEAEPVPEPTIYDHVTTSAGALDVVYNIDLPYSIPGNGKEQRIDLATSTAPAEYKYYCAPRLDGATYLVAEIAEPEKLGLLSAPAGITYDGTWIGETWIDARSTQEKLSLTLGTDKRVSVTRELVREFSSTRATGSTTEQTFTWRLTVRNNQTRAVRMVLKDQYPTSTDRNITVTLDTRATTPWTTNVEETGVVTWEGEMAPGEVRAHTLSYTVKYPRGMTLDM